MEVEYASPEIDFDLEIDFLSFVISELLRVYDFQKTKLIIINFISFPSGVIQTVANVMNLVRHLYAE